VWGVGGDAFLLVFVVYIFRRRRRILVVSFVVMITAVTGYTLKDGVELKGVVDERGKEKRGGDVTVPLPLPLAPQYVHKISHQAV